ncbi:PepSY domain-containing protein [Caulobacter segnis]|uniref:PepSY-associated TM helix domain protein n=2 Tax=Caulobacter segnis TaxID=88688 RepID=D5VK26_CAUST|nr:PepSY-associated TM helix domain-containing protein [Caulobacter segnis]ADG10849.1 PepSY-associated TM helix domain protein [Caulobacter segnis ATCC 21756]AVQ02552.1 PepSY domain-containing protein [Caulobacter segnis]
MDASPDKIAPKTSKAVGAPIWPKIPADFVRAMLAGHSALGLAFAALIYLVCFSGSVAVFTQEFGRWEQPAGPVLSSVSPNAVDAAVKATLAEIPQPHDLLVRLPTPDQPRLSIHGEDASGREHTYVADQAGRLVGEARTPWTEFQAELHTVLHLPRAWGGFVVGLTGVALLSSLISGVLSHPRVFKDAFALRWGGSKRLQEADLHNRISVWGLPFHLAVSLTGAFLGLTTIIVGVLALATFKGDASKAYALFQGPTVKDDPRPAAKVIDVRSGLDAVAARYPDARPTYIYVEHPGERGQHAIINLATDGRLSRGETVVVDGEGRILGEVGYESGSLGFRVLSAMTPLHFGWFGGWPVKVAYFLLGLGLTAVTSSGVAIWLARRRDKGRPAPRWERLWVAFAWSQPLAYAFSALVSQLSPTPAPVAAWGLATLMACGSAAIGTPARISKGLRLISAALLASVAMAHGASQAGVMADPAGWGVDAALIGTALLLALTTLPRRSTAGQHQR